MKRITAEKDYVIVIPETVEEAGLMAWLAKRFAGKQVRFEFDTTTFNVHDEYPAMWIHDTPTAQDGKGA